MCFQPPANDDLVDPTWARKFDLTKISIIVYEFKLSPKKFSKKSLDMWRPHKVHFLLLIR